MENYMSLKENTNKVNGIISTSLGWCFLAIVALMISKWLGFFHFRGKILAIILISGTSTTLVPALMYKLKINDSFLKYYMLMALSLFIGLMGSNNGVGIYITYVLVPIASCMYFDRKFMLKIGLISYLTMTLGVYYNSAGKMEVTYWNWSHMLTFRNYMIGFTIEYAVVMVFLYQLVKRAQIYMEMQQESLRVLEEESHRRDRVSALYKETLSLERKTSYDLIAKGSMDFTNEDYTKLAAGHQYISQLQGILNYSDDVSEAFSRVFESIGEYFKLDRILYVEPDFTGHDDKLVFQWCRYESDRLYDFFTGLTDSEAEVISAVYDKNGYIEYGEGYKDSEDFIDCGLTRYMIRNMLGRHLWLPTVSEGIYSGAFCFDKYERTEYNVVDVILLAEAVNIFASHLSKQRADEANRAKSTFLSTMSHEIRTPMNAIIGMANVSLREDMNDTLRKNLGIIESSGEGLLAIINDILDFSKIESGKVDLVPQDYRVKNLLDDIESIVNARNEEKGLDIKYDFDGLIPSVLNGDSVRIKQVVINLCTNAIKYTEKGSVIISVSSRTKEDKVCMLKFSVSDTGQGIKKEDIPNLFKSFSQVNQSKNHHTEGTGLGLAISKQLVELMHGEIVVESEYGVGSTFWFEVPQKIIDITPIAEVKTEDFQQSDGEELIFSAKGAKVLIVDDNLINLIVAEELMEPFEMEIETATSGKEAIEKTMETRYDLIFMDHFMPEMDGEEVTVAIRNNSDNPNCEVPIVALTADVVLEAKQHMLASGMNDFLAKPIDIKETSRIIRTYIGERIV